MRLRTIRNRHGSAEVACAKWLKGSLVGEPIRLSADNIHVYGAWRRRWRTVSVRFTRDAITVLFGETR